MQFPPAVVLRSLQPHGQRDLLHVAPGGPVWRAEDRGRCWTRLHSIQCRPGQPQRRQERKEGGCWETGGADGHPAVHRDQHGGDVEEDVQ